MSTTELEISRENWMVLACFLCCIIVLILTSAISFNLGVMSTLKKIRHSGYVVEHVETSTNSYYIVEKKVND